ncbi:MAG: lipopolysaccharide kinase InaA family protein [Planctomycetota bacterium]|nr:lipopolysaccharide kinase InaA family protein [Planctomycetota bacterium]
MSPAAFENVLRDLPRIGKLVKSRQYRQVWRFELEGRGYYLKFYPRQGLGLRRLIAGSPARREFSRLQLLQKAEVPSPRAIAQLSGFNLEGIVGDAVILEAIEPAVQLDQYVLGYQLNGDPIPDHIALTGKVCQLLRNLGEAGLGHGDLHLGNLLMRDGEIFLLDGYAVRPGGLKMRDVMQLAHSVRSIATRADLQRGWEELGPGGLMPRKNTVSPRQWRKFIERSRGENDYFGKLRLKDWSGIYFKHYKFPRRWAPASRLNVTAADWQRAWPLLWKQIESDQLTAIKRSPSGDVLSGEVVLGGKPLEVIVKRPYKRYWYRYLNEMGRGSRAARAWKKSWALIVRDIPTAWPLMFMQKRSLGYITDAAIVFARVPGATLASVNLDSLAANPRDMLLRRTGAILRKIDELDLGHFDAKASNWIVQEDEKLGPGPILVDVDGIRFRRWPVLGITRLLKSMLEHPQYTPADSLALCQGYAPFSPLAIRKTGDAEPIVADEIAGQQAQADER